MESLALVRLKIIKHLKVEILLQIAVVCKVRSQWHLAIPVVNPAHAKSHNKRWSRSGMPSCCVSKKMPSTSIKSSKRLNCSRRWTGILMISTGKRFQVSHWRRSLRLVWANCTHSISYHPASKDKMSHWRRKRGWSENQCHSMAMSDLISGNSEKMTKL